MTSPSLGRAGGARRRLASSALAVCVLVLGASGLLSLTWCAQRPPHGVQQSRRFTGPALASDAGARRSLEGDRTGLQSRGGETAKQTMYVTGITWYLAHFLVSIGNDGIMKFLGGSLPPFQIVFLRFLTAGLVLLPILLSKGAEGFKTQRMWMHGLRGTLLALGIGLWCKGLAMMPFASCVVINNTMPFFKMLFAQFLLGETVGRQRWIASLAGFAGCLIVFNPTAATFQPQSLVLILSACCFAMLDILNKKFAFSESIVSMLFYGSIATAMVSAYQAYSTWVPLVTSQYLLIGLLGIGANALLFCLLKAFQYVDASATCPYRYTEFVLSAILGFLAFGEKPGWSTLLGSCIILPSVVYCAYVETREDKSEKQEETAAAA